MGATLRPYHEARGLHRVAAEFTRRQADEARDALDSHGLRCLSRCSAEPRRGRGTNGGAILEAEGMRTFNVVVERDPDTGTYVGYVPGWPGAHTQGDTLDELQTNLKEVLAMLLEDGDPRLESEFVGVQTIKVA